MDVQVQCRKCGRKALSSLFKVDYVYKMAVCPECIRERQKSEPLKKYEEKKPILNQEIHVRGIDEQIKDPELEKAYRKKQDKLAKEREGSVKVRLFEDNKAIYPCTKCGYKFKYNFEFNKPTKCPYCGEPIKKITFT